MKTCTRCHLTKDLTEFKVRKDRGTHDSFCISCRSAYYKEQNYDRKAYQSNYVRNVTEERKKYLKDYLKPRRKKYREKDKLHKIIGGMVRRVLKYKSVKKTTTKCELLGWSKVDFVQKIGPLIPGSHIDHKIPVSWFVQDAPVSIINNLENLQMLSCQQNTSKRNRYCHPVSRSYLTLASSYIKPSYLLKCKILENC